MTANVTNDSCSYNSTSRGEEIFTLITCGVLMNGIGAMGIIGNVISMIILSRPKMKSSINYLLTRLVGWDTVLIVCCILLYGLPSILYTKNTEYFYYSESKFYPYLHNVIYPVALTAQTMSVYLTLTVTLERYFAVCRPLQALSLCTYGRARRYVVFITIFSILYNLPRFWEFYVIEYDSRPNNWTVFKPNITALRQNETYAFVYINCLYMLMMYILPFSCLAVLNRSIYRKVQRANQERKILSKLQKREIRLATMLLCIVAVFMLCNFLPLVLNVMEASDIKGFCKIRFIKQIIETCNLLVTTNSSVNFIIYVIFGDKFKRLFLAMFCSRKSWWFPFGSRGRSNS